MGGYSTMFGDSLAGAWIHMLKYLSHLVTSVQEFDSCLNLKMRFQARLNMIRKRFLRKVLSLIYLRTQISHRPPNLSLDSLFSDFLIKRMRLIW